MSAPYQAFGVIGGGAWGTALAQTLAVAGRDVLIWTYEPECAEAINTHHENTLYLKGIRLDPRIRATITIADLERRDAILAVAPAQYMRTTLKTFAPYVRRGLPIIMCSKGIEYKSLSFMNEVLKETIPQAQPVVLSGPSFAVDVAKGLPAAVTLAVEDKKLGEALAGAIASPGFRPYLGHDLLGTEIGGVVKNVLAIACGMVLGKQLGKSAHAALITRGFAEMMQLGIALGVKPETLTGLCGLGDLVLTCSNEQSRNMSCGFALGQGKTLKEIMDGYNVVTEGVATAPALKRLAKKAGVKMPICDAVTAILDGSVSVDSALTGLFLSCDQRMETDT